MKIPKEIADKVSQYQIAKKKAEILHEEIAKWLDENTDVADSVYVEDIYITENPTGKKQTADGEYCEQHEFGDSGDSFYGEYYHQIEDSDKYVGYHYNC